MTTRAQLLACPRCTSRGTVGQMYAETAEEAVCIQCGHRAHLVPQEAPIDLKLHHRREPRHGGRTF